VRLVRLRIANFRGVTARELHFTEGVTIVEGPNEVGKSTLAEALLLLIDPGRKSDSRHKEVERVRPIGRDEVPEVEAEFAAGAARFVYEKRFSPKKGGGTELRVLAPRAEQLAGDAAAQRFDELLAEHLDVELFRALCVEQGRAVGQTPLGGKAWLARALDEAAGGARDEDGRHETLFEAARRRHLEFFTEKTGNPTGALKKAAEARDLAEERHRTLERRLAALEAQVDEHARLVARIRETDAALPRFEAEARAAQAAVEALAELERRVETNGTRLAAARTEVAGLRSETERRRALREQIAADERRLEDEDARVAARAAELGAARAARDAAEAALRDALRAVGAAVDERDQARNDLARLAAAERATLLRGRHDRAVELRARIEELESSARDGIAPEVVKGLEVAERAARSARDQLRSAGARLTFEALHDLDLLVDGTEQRLGAGETLPHEPGSSIDLTIPDLARIRLDAGAGTAALTEAAEAAESRLRDALRAAGVADLEAARERAQRARVAEVEVRAARAALGDLAEGLAPAGGGSVLDALDAALRDLREEQARLDAARPAGRAEPRDAAQAAELLRGAEAGEHQARSSEKETRDARDAQNAQIASLEAERAGAEATRSAGRGVLAERRAELEASGNARPDPALAADLDEALRRLAGLEAEAAGLAERLAGADKEQKQFLAENAEAALAGLRGRRGEDEAHRREIEAVLRHDAGEGLGEELQVAAAALEQCEEQLALLRRRAEAAKLLFATMVRRRGAARAARVRPLTDQLERLGRIAFGDSFRVALDEDLAIATRTLGGLTVPFDSLSVGAREQLDLLMRIAVAQTVAAQGGVPLILDDTLGNADPERLGRMNALLKLAGQTVQVVVLTCHPDRFARVGGAQLLRLAPGGGLPG
jgi:hypothetical protein